MRRVDCCRRSSNVDKDAIRSDVIGSSYPPAIEIANGRLRRDWVARTSRTLPAEAALAALGRKIEDEVHAAIATAFGTVATEAELKAARASISLARLDDLHLVVRIEFAGPDTTVGDAAVISQWGALQRLDREVPIDDLQGLPRSYWFPLATPEL